DDELNRVSRQPLAFHRAARASRPADRCRPRATQSTRAGRVSDAKRVRSSILDRTTADAGSFAGAEAGRHPTASQPVAAAVAGRAGDWPQHRLAPTARRRAPDVTSAW